MSSKRSTTCEIKGLRQLAWTRHFDGQLLLTDDLENQRQYHQSALRRHQSHAHGVGTVCGLKVSQHPAEECRHQYVVLEPGLAYDCCGREIVVPERTVIDLRGQIEQVFNEEGLFPEEGTPASRTIYMMLRYAECDEQLVPALVDDCGCADGAEEYSRTREVYETYVSLNAPTSTDVDLNAEMEWVHTLPVIQPTDLAIDRVIDRLYLIEGSGHLRMFNTDNHDQLARVQVSTNRPTKLGLSLSGEFIYIADYDGEANQANLIVIRQDDLETQRGGLTDMPSFPIVNTNGDAIGGRIVGMQISPRDDSVILLMDSGVLIRYTMAQINSWLQGGSAPEPLVNDLTDVPAITAFTHQGMAISSGGRWLIVANGHDPQLIVISTAQFFDGTDITSNIDNKLRTFGLLDGTEIPAAIGMSLDDAHLYVLCSQPKLLYRLTVGNHLDSFLPDIAGDERDRFARLDLSIEPATTGENTVPTDISISPRERQAYLLYGLLDDDDNPYDRGRVQIVDLTPFETTQGDMTEGLDADEIASLATALFKSDANTRGQALFQNLAFVGQRLYVAGNVVTPGEADALSILDVNAAACDSIFHSAIEGCPICAEGNNDLVIATIRDYVWNAPMVEDVNETNYIDNLSDRLLAPSTDILRQVIQCMLDAGITEGMPGPRGPQGATGERGRSIDAVELNVVDGETNSATLVPIAGDPENDYRLVITLDEVEGPPGPPGERGRSIDDVRLTVSPDVPTSASLEPIEGDPENDWRLVLSLNIPEVNIPTPPDYTSVINASWHHDEVVTLGEFFRQFVTPADNEDVEGLRGFAIQFENEILVDTAHSRSAYVLIRMPEFDDALGLTYCDCILPTSVWFIRNIEPEARELQWFVGNNVRTQSFELINQYEAFQAEEEGVEVAEGILLSFLPATASTLGRRLERALSTGETVQLSVVLKGDWILDTDNNALDGNNIYPSVPDRPSGNGAMGDDWISLLHITFDRA